MSSRGSQTLVRDPSAPYSIGIHIRNPYQWMVREIDSHNLFGVRRIMDELWACSIFTKKAVSSVLNQLGADYKG